MKIQVVLPAGTATAFYDRSGIPLSTFVPAVVMSAENLVDAALAGLDQDEDVTLPSVHDTGLWEDFDAVRAKLFAAIQNGAPLRDIELDDILSPLTRTLALRCTANVRKYDLGAH